MNVRHFRSTPTVYKRHDTRSRSIQSLLKVMESQRFSRRIRGLAPERDEYMDRCFVCLLLLTINSLTSSLVRSLSCCGKFVHDRCQKRWESMNTICGHCRQPIVQESKGEDAQEEPQRLVAREAWLYRVNNDVTRSVMNVGTYFCESCYHAIN